MGLCYVKSCGEKEAREVYYVTGSEESLEIEQLIVVARFGRSIRSKSKLS